MAAQHNVTFATSPQISITLPLEIEEPLQDIVVRELSVAIFECKLRGIRIPSVTWYKDGQELEQSQRYQITNNEQWYRLEITSARPNDFGMYTILCSNGTTQIISKANLYIKPVRNFCDNDEIIYMDPYRGRSNRVLRHLFNVTIKVGKRVELEMELQTGSAEKFYWYKSNCLINPDTRIIILNDNKTSILSIHRAQQTDTGLYHVVAITGQGVVSSFAEVIVTDNQENKEFVPIIEEGLPDELELNEKEEIRLICKAKLDSHSNIQWQKNGLVIKENNKIIPEDYGNKYIGLRIVDPQLPDMGEYTVTLRNLETGQVDSSVCFLSLNACPAVNLPIVQLLKPLDTVLACFGSKVALKCSFSIKDTEYFYVVWHVGRFRVERTNHRFNVMCNGGDFFLVIKQLELDMTGEAVCELRRALPNRRSVLVNSTSSNVVIVPPCFFDQNLKLSTQERRQVYYRMGTELGYEEVDLLNMDFSGDETINQRLVNEILTTNHGTVMEIDFCRFGDDGSCFMDVLNQHNEVCYNSLTVVDKLKRTAKATKQMRKGSDVVTIQWDAPHLDVWYEIGIRSTNRNFINAGVTSVPMFELKFPSVNKMIKLRIRAIEQGNEDTVSTVRITLPSDVQPSLTNKCELKAMDRFDSFFTKTGDFIGCGAFGSVVLVRDNRGDHYAAKILKTRTQKKRDTAMREFDIMKQIKHSKLVELFDAYASKDSFVLVMNYLWGGELFDRIVEEEHIKEVDVVPYVRQACEALEYLHALKIAHLDVKPENIICLNPNSLQVKLIDFGLARVLEEDNITRAIYGTKDYVAPEVLNFEQLTLASDMWSLGVVTYMLLSGVMPFAGETWPQRSANITRANYNYHDSAFKEISDLARDFVDRLLVINPARRMNATMALNHQWIVEGPPKGAKAGHMKRTRENLKSYLANYRARWQRAGNVMIAAHRLRNQIGQRNSSDSEIAPLQVT